MPERQKLTDLEVRQKMRPGTKPGLYGDGGGLWLQVTPRGSCSWLLRFQRAGKARAMGLGPADIVSLKDARERARAARRLLLDDVDPIDARNEQKARRKADAARAVTFKSAADRFLSAHERGWRNEKHRSQWKSTLATYCHPVIGDMPVADIDTALILKILEPLWEAKPETGTRVRGRIEAILDWAAARNFRQGANPARWKGHLDKLLAPRSKIAKVQHHPAMPYQELPAFFAELDGGSGIARYALKFAILTASRTGEVIGAKWSEIDLEAKIQMPDGTFRACPLWTVPATRMKAGREHRIPLAPLAADLLKSVPRIDGSEFVFPGARRGKPLSNMAMLQLMRGIRPDYVPHGFRSTFRDYAFEATQHPREIAEAALAHVVGDKVEAAYRRGDALAKRLDLMNDWAGFCAGAT